MPFEKNLSFFTTLYIIFFLIYTQIAIFNLKNMANNYLPYVNYCLFNMHILAICYASFFFEFIL